MSAYEYDAVIVGSGPNGLAAGITLQRKGLSVLILEAKDTIGGGLRTKELTLPGFKHDVCSAIHPMAVGSPFFAELPLHQFGLQFIHAPVAAAHPFDSGHAAVLMRSLVETAEGLEKDKEAYLRLIKPLVETWPDIAPDAMGPLRFPKHPFKMAAFGLNAIRSASCISKRFETEEAKGLWAGMSAHSIQPLTNWASAAIGLVLSAVGHIHGWPIPVGGSQSIADAMGAYFVSLGGIIQTGIEVHSLRELPKSKAILFDVTPSQLLKIVGNEFTGSYRKQLSNYRYGMGVFKVDWALNQPVPFKNHFCRQAGTVHLGNTFEEIAASEQAASDGKHPDRPFVLLAQQSSFDRTRAPGGKHTAWAYCHVPNGSTVDMTKAIEDQVERFAPGFKDTILAKHTMNTSEIQAYNPNYIGGDINGGIIDIRQLYTRPTLSLSPYRTSREGIYICSSSTPPGGGVHGMCGYHAAQTVIKDLFS